MKKHILKYLSCYFVTLSPIQETAQDFLSREQNTNSAMKNLKSMLLMPLVVLVVLFGSGNVWGQNSFNSGDGWGAGWGTGAAFTASAGTSLIYTTTNTSGGSPTNRYFRFYGTGTPCGEYGPSGASDVLLTPATAYTSSTITCGSAKAFYLSVSNTSDNWVFKSVSATAQRIIIFRVQGSIQSVSSVTQSPTVANGVAPGQAVTVTANLSGALATGQNVYLRYSTDNFSTSTIATFSGSGSTYTATIPAGTNTAGAAVKYYVFTSGATPSSADADFYTINLNNNSGSNYSYTVASQFYSKSTGNLETLSNWGTNTDGTGTAPANFTSNGVTYNIRNNATPTISGAWTVSGTSSKVIVGDGTNACTLTLPSGTSIYNSVATDVSNNATVKFQNATAPTFGTTQFLSGSVYEHNLGASGGTIPAATWNINSTCRLKYTANSSSPPSGLSQTFGKFEIDCASQTSNNIVITPTNVTNEFRVTSTGTGSFQLQSLVIDGNYIQTGGTIKVMNSTGTATANIKGSYTLNGGAFTISDVNGSANAVNLIIDGACNLTSGTFSFQTNSSSGLAYFQLKGTTTISSGIAFAGVLQAVASTNSGFYFNRATAGTISLNVSVPTSGWNSIRTAFFYNTTNVTGINETYNGLAAQTTVDGTIGGPGVGYATWPTSGTVIKTVTISNTAGVTASIAKVINTSLVIDASCLYNIGANAHTIASGATGTINGTLRSAATITATGTLTFSSTGTYQHNFTTTNGTIPTATWSSGSTCSIIGYTSNNSATGGIGQSFSNFTWNCPNQAGNINLSGGLTTINGNFNITSTGASSELRMSGSTAYALTIGGNFSIAGGIVDLSSGTGNVTWNIAGNFSQSGGTFKLTGSGTKTINFNKSSGSQTFTQSAGTISNAISWNVGNGSTTNTLQLASNVNLGTGTGTLTVSNNASLDFQTYTLSGSGTFTASSGSTLISANTNATGAFNTAGANGSVQTTTRTFSNAGVNYTFNGASVQNTGNAIGSATNTNIKNLTINNSSGVTLSSSAVLSATGALSFINGNLTIGANDLTLTSGATISGATSARYVNTASTGQLKQTVAASSVTFPVGNSAYNPISITNSGTSDTYGIIAKDGAVPNALDATKAVDRYWAVTEGVAGSGNLAVTAQFNTADGAGAGYATTTNPQFIGLYPNATPWTQVSSGAAASGSNPYTVSASGFTNSLPTSGSTYYFAVGISGAFNVPAPTITASGGVVASSPGATTSGYVGNTITINGTGLGSVTVVKVGGSAGTSVTIVSQSATTLTFAAINLGGTIYVENPGGNATSTEFYTNLGYITTQTGGWSTAATWLGGAVPPSATNTDVTIAHNVTSTSGTTNVGKLTVNASTTLTITASTTLNINVASTNSGTITNNGTLATAATYTNSGTMTMNGTFQLNSGGWATGSNFVYGASGTLNFNTTTAYTVNNTDVFWPTSNGPFNVSVLQGGLTLNSANRTVAGTFATAAGVTQTSSTLTISGTNQLNSGGFFNSAPTYSGSATLIYNTTGTYGISNEWTGNATTAGSGVPFNVTIQNSTTLTFPTTNRGIGGAFNVSSGGATLNATSGDLYVAGNFTNNGTFTHNTRAVFLNGTTQTISGSALNTSGTTNCFDYLFIQNNSQVTLGAAVTIRTNLTFTSGDIILSTFDLTLASGATITGVSSTNYIVTNSTGQLKRTVTSSAVSFPVGNSAYNPITFTNAGTSDTYGIRVVDGAPTNAADALVTVQRSWYITEAVAGNSDLTPVVAQYNSGEVGANYNAGTTPYMGLYNGSSWTQVATTLGGSITATSTGTAQFPATIPAGSYIAIGKDQGLASTPPTITSFSATSGYSGSSIVITGTNLTGATAVSFGGTAAASFTVNSATQITAVVGTGGASGSVSVTTPSGSVSLAGFTYLGFITTSGASNWNTGASWLGGVVPTSATTTDVTIAHNVTSTTGTTNVGKLTINGSTTLTITAATSVNINTASTNSGTITNNGTLSTAATYTNSGTMTINGTFQINQGGFASGGTWTYGASGTLVYNNSSGLYGSIDAGHSYWPASSGPANVTVQGGGGINMGVSRTVSGTFLLVTGTDAVQGTALTLNGTTQINGGNFQTTPIYGSASTLIYNFGGTYGISNEWTGNSTTAGSGIPFNVTIQNGTTLTFPTTNRGIGGNFNVASGGATLNATSGDLYVAGNFTNNGTFTHNTRAVFLNGTTQIISGSALNTSGTTNCFDYLFIQNNSQVTLGAAVTIRSNLNFTSGDIILSTFDLTLASGATITGASSANYVITNNTGMLVRTLATSTAVTFPIGNSAYNPITISQSGASDVYSLRMIDGSISGLSPNDVTRTINRRWSASRTSSTNVNITVSSISYNTGEENNATNFNGGTQPYYGLYNGTSWVQATATQGAQTFTSANTVASSTATSFSVAMGKDLAFVPPAPTVTSIDVASGYSGSTIVITGTSFTGATAVSFGGTAAASYTVNSATQITAVVGTGGASGDVSITTPSGTGSLTGGFTYLGFITTSGASNWNATSSWLGGVVPTANNTVTVAHNLSIAAAFTNSPIASITVNTGITATASATIAIGTVTGAITTVGTGVFTFTGASGSITAGSFVNGGTLSWGAAATLNISASGTLTNNGTFIRGTGTVNFLGAGTVNGSSAITFNNLTLNGGLTLTTVPTINGSMQINSGGFVSAAPNYGSSSTLIYNSGGTYGVSSEWTSNALSGTGIPQNVTIGNGVNTTLSFGTATQFRQLLGNLVISASSGLTLSSNAGGDLNVAGNWTNGGTFTHNSRAVTFNGTAAQTINSATTFAFLTIANTSANVTAAANITIAASGVLTINSSARLDIAATTLTLTGATSSINGFLRSAGTITGASASTLTIANGGTYEHNYTTTAGTIPTATWSSGSTCSIIGYTAGSFTMGSSFGQSFSNFTWNCPNQTANINLTGNLTTVNGNLTIQNTNTGTVRLTGNTTLTLTVGGNLIINGGTLYLVTGSSVGPFNITGGLIISSGTLDINNAGSGTQTINIGGAFNQSGGIFTRTSGSAATVNFNKSSGSQALTQSSGTISGTNNWNVGTGSSTNTVQLASNVNLGTGTGTFTVLGNATFDAGTYVLSGSAASTFNSGANIITANTGGVNGSVTLSGTRTYNAAANYTFNNSTPSAQVTGAAVTAANNITINNSAGVSLSAGTTVSGALTLTSGKLAIGSYTLTLNGTVVSMSASNSLVGSSTSDITIGGTGALGTLFFDQTTSGTTNLINDFTINRTSSGSAALGNNLNINGTLTFANGNLDLNGSNNVTLGSSVSIASESCTNGFINSGSPTQGNGFVQTTRNFVTGTDYLGVTITSATNLGSTNIKRFVQKAASDVGATAGIKRIYSITPTNAATANVTLTSSYCDGELNGNTESSPALITYYGTGSDETTGYGNFYTTASNTTTTNTVTTPASASLVVGQNNIILANPGNDAYYTVTDGDWNTAGTWVLGAVPPAGVATSVRTLVTVNGTVSNAPLSITVDASKSLTFGSAGTITTTTLTNNGSVIMTNGGTITIANNGTFANGANTFTAGSGTVAFAGTGTVSGTITFNNTTLAGGVDFGSSSTIGAAGSLQINAGGFVNTNAPSYNATSTLIYNSGSSYGRGTEWSAVSGKGYPGNVTIQNGTAVTWGAPGIDLSTQGNLNLGTTGSAGSLTLANGFKLLVPGNITIGSNSGTSTLALSSTSGGDIKVGGNWTTTANGVFTPNTRAVFFTGSGTNVINSSGGTSFDYLVSDKTGGSIQLGSDLTVNAPSSGNALSLKSAAGFDLNGNILNLTNAAASNIQADGGVVNFTGTGTINFSGAGTKNVTAINSGTVVFGSNITLITSTGVNFGSVLSTINGTLQINANGFVSTNAPLYTSNSQLIYNSGGTFIRSTEWSATSGAGYPHHIKLSNNTTLNVNNSENVVRQIAGNLTIDAGSTFNMQDMSISNPTEIGVIVTGDITNNGTITLATSTERLKSTNFTNNIGATCTLSSTIGGDLEVTGNLVDNGSLNVGINTRAIFFTGTGVQDVSGSGTFNIDYIVSNKASGRIRLLNNILVEGPNGGNAINLINSSDILDLNGFTLTLGKASVASVIIGNGSIRGSSTSSISILGTGALGTLRFDQTTPGTTDALQNLTINRTSTGSVTLGTSLTVGGNLTCTDGTFALGGNTLTYSGSSITRTSGAIDASNASATLAFTNTSALTLPASIFSGNINNLTMNGAGGITLGSATTVAGTLKLTSGDIITTAANTLELGISTTQLGTLDYTAGYVVGKMKRWFNSTNSGNASGLFPMGLDVSGLKNRFAKVEYTSAASDGGHLTVQFVSANMEMAGLPIVSANTGGFGSDVTSTENQGYWQIDNESGKLTDGEYTISVTGEGFATINSLSGITLLKRVGAGNWTAPGTHVAASGSTAVPTVSRSGVSGWSNFGFGGNTANPLPVELIDFSAFCDKNSSQLTWATASEKNSDYFEVEVSTDLVSWSELAQVNAAGNSISKIEYTIADNLSRGLRYYRLVQVDFDGKQRIYDPISLNCEGSESVFLIYPNPTSGDFVVSIQNEKLSGEIAVTLNTSDGKLIASKTSEATTGVQSIYFENNNLPAGIYFVRIVDKIGSELVGKVVVR